MINTAIILAAFFYLFIVFSLISSSLMNYKVLSFNTEQYFMTPQNQESKTFSFEGDLLICDTHEPEINAYYSNGQADILGVGVQAFQKNDVEISGSKLIDLTGETVPGTIIWNGNHYELKVDFDQLKIYKADSGSEIDVDFDIQVNYDGDIYNTKKMIKFILA